MAGRNVIKPNFETGDRPDQAQYAQMLDAYLNLADDRSLLGLREYDPLRPGGYKAGEACLRNGQMKVAVRDTQGTYQAADWRDGMPVNDSRPNIAVWTPMFAAAEASFCEWRGVIYKVIAAGGQGIEPDSVAGAQYYQVVPGPRTLGFLTYVAGVYGIGAVMRWQLGLIECYAGANANGLVDCSNDPVPDADKWRYITGVALRWTLANGQTMTGATAPMLNLIGNIEATEGGFVNVPQYLLRMTRAQVVTYLTADTGMVDGSGNPITGWGAPGQWVVITNAVGGTRALRLQLTGRNSISALGFDELAQRQVLYNFSSDTVQVLATEVAPVVITIGVAQLPVNGAQSTNPAGANYYPPSGSTGNWGSEIANRQGQIYKISGSNIYFHYTQAGAENAFAWRAGENETPAWDFGFVRLSDGAFLKLDEYLYPTWQATVSANTVSFGLPAGQQNFGVENRPLDVAFATLETSQSIITFNDQQPLNARFFGLKIRNTSTTNLISISLPSDYKRTDSTLPVLQIPPLSEGLLSVYNDFAAGVGGRLLHWEPAYRARNRRYRARLTIDDLNMTATVDHVFETDFGPEINWEVVDASGDLQLRSSDWATIVIVGGSPTVYRPVAYHLSALYSNSGSGIASFTGVPLGICEDFNNPHHINLYKDGRPGPFVVHIDATVYYDEGL